ncbi:hypothetical protein BJ138DRAFT_1016601 [Hygrophoropsis aurantiaca]|uniref:Uncharacterized protein n=1 Tax=Hygrophoropsis aurantiaca TaxID=72124 RepID=A0ACB7ZZV9_9AGAM|nr:hypothetical protein BJ138DRAFT_1016601 [Hygrophoropsis aurantiaca]
MVDIMGNRDNQAFAGIGRHLAHDFLHLQGLFPTTPPLFVCQDGNRFNSFKSGIGSYMAIWSNIDYLRKTANSVNSHNPLAYNTKSFTNYFSSYLHVFRRSQTEVSVDLYNQMVGEGLLNPAHVIGQPYEANESEFERVRRSKWLPVYQRGKDIYTVICARCPDGWQDGPKVTNTDLRLDGYKTTIGVAEFREVKNNKINCVDSESRGQVGRRPGVGDLV